MSAAMNWEQSVLQLRAAPERAELVRACFYDDPLLESATRYWQSSEWQAVRSLLPAVGDALDVGAGRGISSFALAKDGWKVSALEPDPSPIVGAAAIRGLAAAANLPIEVAEAWGERLPFADASFDLVHCRQVLHHARDLPQLCRQIGRVLKPGGVLIATREHVISQREDLAAFLAGHPLHQLYGGENAYLRTEYTSAITQAGMVILREFNPLESDINLYPQTRAAVKARWAARLGLPPSLVPDWVLAWVGARSSAPGRLYTFLARKDAQK